MSGGDIFSAKWFASTVIDNFIERVIGYLSGNRALHKGTAEMLDNLKNMLPQIQAIMEEAAKQHIQNEGLIKWLKSIKDAAYEAEDVLDDFEKKRIHEDLMGKGMVSKFVSSIVKASKNLILLDDDVENLNKIVEKLDQNFQKSDTFVKLLQLDRDLKGKDPEIAGSAKNTPILPHKPKLFGRDEERKLLISLILGYEEALSELSRDSQDNNSEAGPSNTSDTGSAKEAKAKSVQEQGIGEDLKSKSEHYGRPHIIPIVGICGIGKTALAQTIYSYPLLKGRFELKKWFYMSKTSDVHELVKSFVPTFDHDDPSDLKKKLNENLTGKRFLLVLDDVCSEVCSKLEEVLPLFNSGTYGSVILVTTREHNVSNILGTVAPISLNALEWNAFLELLEYYAFKDNDIARENRHDFHLELRNIGSKLNGIPQAAKIVGNMLRLNMDLEYWKHIFCELKYRNSVFSFLDIAYQHIDANLKNCFGFCLTFPTNYIIERDRIIQMWIANSFIQLNSHDERRSKNIGEMWFNKLVNMSFFIPTPWPQKYVMNRAMRELAVSVFSDEVFIFDDNPNPCPYGCFLLNEKPFLCFHGYAITDDGPRSIPPSTRYLTVRTKMPTIDLGGCTDNLRTLLFHSDYYESPITLKRKRSIDPLISRIMKKDSILHSTSKLRVLELSHPNGVERHVKAISELLHLRILDLSFTGIKEFPESLCSLCHLQVLDVRGCKFEMLPKKFNCLINLRHLYASRETTSLISGIGKLTNLQELEEFRITKMEGYTISELAEMKDIGGHLRIVGLENVKDEVEAAGARLAEKNYLKILTLRWAEKHSEKMTNSDNKEKANNILNSLEPHSAIEGWEVLDYPGTELPSWTTLPRFTRSIYLKGCRHLEYIPPFGQLHFLETLLLEDLTIKHIGEQFYGTGPVIFPVLKVLKFVGMKKWEVWSCAGQREFLPRLEELVIRDCDQLKETPLWSLNLSCLRKLELSACKGVLLEGSICNKRLPLLSSLCISENPHIILEYQNMPNLRLLLLQKTSAEFTGGQPYLADLGSLILESSFVHWIKEPFLRFLTELKMPVSIGRFMNIMQLNLPSLRILNLIVHGHGILKVLDEWFLKLPHLVELTFCFEDLLDDHSGFTLAPLISLKLLTITFKGFTTFQFVPETPPNLKELHIMDMQEELMQRCIPDGGEDWHKIAHIPYIRVNGKTLQML